MLLNTTADGEEKCKP